MRPLPGPAPEPRASRPAGLSGWDLAGLAALAGLVRLPALFASRHHHYDDGGYGLAVVALRQGFLPFRDVFSSQGPLFLPLLRLGDVLTAGAPFGPRVVPVAAGVAVTLATAAVAADLADRPRALLAGVLAATSGSLLWATGPITSDGVTAAIVTTAVAVALRYRRDPTTARVVTLLALAGAAVSVKHLMAGPALAAVWAVVATTPHPRRRLRAVALPLGAAVVLVATALPYGAHVIDGYFRYHLTKAGQRDPAANLVKLASTMLRRDLPLLAVGAGGIAAAALRAPGRGRPPRRPRGRLAAAVAGERVVWWWAGLALALLAWQEPMFRNHIAALVPPVAVLGALHRPPWRWTVALGLAGAVVSVPHLRPLLAPEPYRGAEAAVVGEIRSLPPGAWALSDEPGFVWRGGAATDPFFVDPSVLRIRNRHPAIRIDARRVVAAAADPRVCLVVVWSRVRFGSFDDLGARLARLGFRRSLDLGRERVTYHREPCRPDRDGRATATPAPGR
jgi:hypothetical protein